MLLCASFDNLIPIVPFFREVDLLEALDQLMTALRRRSHLVLEV